MSKVITIDNGKFTPCVAVFDPEVDIQEVDQFGFIDLRQAFLTGTVDGVAAPDSDFYSGVDDPEGILPAPKDKFEAIRQAQYAAEAGKSSRSKSSQPAATAAPSTEGEGASSAAGE